MMALKEMKMEETLVCIMCGGAWSSQNEMEKYCGECKTHIVIIDDEIYYAQGW